MLKVRTILFALLIGLLLVACTSGGADEEPTTPDGTASEQDAAVEVAEENGDEAETAESPPEANPDEQTIIQFATYDWEMGQYRDLIETFEEENPDILIQTVSVEEILDLDPTGSWQWPDDASVRLASAADVTSVGLGGDDFSLDLKPLMEADASFDVNDFYGSVFEQLETDEGAIYGLPLHLNFSVLFYDKDMFDAAGVPYPEPGWTWDDFLNAAVETTIREGDEVTQWGFVQPWADPISLIEPQAGALFDSSTTPPSANFDRPEVAEAVAWYVSLVNEYEVMPFFAPPEPDNDEPFVPEGYQLLDEGRVAMWAEDSGAWQWRAQTGDRNLGMAPFPVNEAGESTMRFFYSTISISKGTRSPEAAWRWLNFLSQQAEGVGFGNETAVPARQSVAEASGFWNNLDEEVEPTLRYAVENASSPTFGIGGQQFTQEISKVILEDKPIADALADAQQAAAEELAEFLEEEGEEEDVPEIVVSEAEVEAAPEGAETILFMTNGGNLSQFRDLVDAFREENPNIVVELLTPDFSGGGPISTADVAADSDCFQWFVNVQDEEDRSQILSISPFLDADSRVSEADFFPGAVAQVTEQGQIWGLPAVLNVVTMSYNKDLFDEAGIDYPEMTWTLDDFVETAVALTDGEDEATRQYGYLPSPSESNDLLFFLNQFGVSLIDGSVSPPQLAYTSPELIEAVRWYSALSTEFDVKPTFSSGDTGFADWQLHEDILREGRAALWINSVGGGIIGGNDDGPAYEMGVVPFPRHGESGARSGISFSSNYFISADTEARQACWEWINFLTQQVTFSERETGAIPARIELAESDRYAQTVGEEAAAANLASIGEGELQSIFQSFAGDSWLTPSYFWFQRAYEQILSEEQAVEEALVEVQALADAYRTCLIEQEAIGDVALEQQCLRETDETLPDFLFTELNN